MHIVIQCDPNDGEESFVYYIEDQIVGKTKAALIAQGFEEVSKDHLDEECNITNLTYPSKAFHLVRVDI